MAVSTGSQALYSDMKNWYDVFNNLASNYSNGISTLTVPSSGSKISATHINNLNDKIDEFRSDYYLGTKSAWWPIGSDVTVGTLIKPGLTGILGVVSNATKVVCRNIANNSSGTYSCGSYSSGANSYGIKSNGTLASGSNSCGEKTYGANVNGTYGNGAMGNGPCPHTMNSSGSNQNADCPNGLCNSGTCGSGTNSSSYWISCTSG